MILYTRTHKIHDMYTHKKYIQTHKVYEHKKYMLFDPPGVNQNGNTPGMKIEILWVQHRSNSCGLLSRIAHKLQRII
jgi:hypothetical protein